MQPWWQPRPPISAGSRIPPGLTVPIAVVAVGVAADVAAGALLVHQHVPHREVAAHDALPFGKCRNTGEARMLLTPRMQPACETLAVVVVVGIGERVVAAAGPRRQLPADASAVASIVASAPSARRGGVLRRRAESPGGASRATTCSSAFAASATPPPPSSSSLRRAQGRATPARAAAGVELSAGLRSSKASILFVRGGRTTWRSARPLATRCTRRTHRDGARAKHGVAWPHDRATGMATTTPSWRWRAAAANLGAALQNSQQLVPLGYVGLEVTPCARRPFVARCRRAICAISRNFADSPPPADRPPRGARAAREDRRDRRPADGGGRRAHARPRERPAARARRRVHVRRPPKSLRAADPRLWQRDGRRRAGGRLRGRERGGRDVRERADGPTRRSCSARARKAAEWLFAAAAADGGDAKGWAPRATSTAAARGAARSRW